LSHLVELPITKAFKSQPKHLQVNYAAFKKEWLIKFNQIKPSEKPFTSAQKADSKTHKDDGL